MPMLKLVLSEDEHRALNELGRREFRNARQQAAFIIRHELERRGLLDASGHELADRHGPTGVGWATDEETAAGAPTSLWRHDDKPRVSDDRADVLARVYALILSWPAADEARTSQSETHPTGDRPSVDHPTPEGDDAGTG